MKGGPKRNRRNLFVLTPEEKRTLLFVLAAVILGLGAKQYRQKYSVRLAETGIIEAKKNVGLPAEKRAEAKRRRAGK